jgi:hypothetical protein
VQVVATGGAGLSGLADLAKAAVGKPKGLDELPTALEHFLTQFTFANSAPIGFHAISMEAYGYRPTQRDDLWTDVRESHLQAIVEEFRKLQQWRDTADAVAARPGDYTFLASADRRPALAAARDAWDKRMITLASAHKSCKENVSQDCSLPQRPESLPGEDLLPKLPHLEACRNYDLLSERDVIRRRVGVCLCEMISLQGGYVRGISLLTSGNSVWSTTIGSTTAEAVPVLLDEGLERMLGQFTEQARSGVSSGSAPVDVVVADQFGRQHRWRFATYRWESHPERVPPGGQPTAWLGAAQFDMPLCQGAMRE